MGVDVNKNDDGRRNMPKSEWHEKVIRWFVKEMYK